MAPNLPIMYDKNKVEKSQLENPLMPIIKEEPKESVSKKKELVNK
jgi:hypothetical protein